LMFGGFDSQHRPLNDLWSYEVPTESITSTNVEVGVTNVVTVTVTNAAVWTQITNFQNTERPQPRAGASMIYWGDYDYDRGLGDAYKASANKRKIVMFGGTDGKTYFNDTWVYDGNRWILANPAGAQSQGPSPRAFASMVYAQNARKLPDPNGTATFHSGAPDDEDSEDNDEAASKGAKISAFLFGGRTGTIPTGLDTDGDMVDDGVEHELGGPGAGRDPRVNKLVQPGNATETIPFAYNKIGPIPYAADWVLNRGAIADMESLRNDDGVYAASRGLPFEFYAEPDAVVHVIGSIDSGVDAERVDQTSLWYHRYGGENPFDSRDVWERGVPDNSSMGSNASPRYAYSGRWCYGTSLHSTYPNDAIMELYSPLMDLHIPARNGTSTNNMNSYFLVFHEWLDLFDSNDVVRVEAVRPETPADINTRRTGVNKPVLPVLPDRNGTFNTLGAWRRVIVPLDNVNNESNVYFRFTLQSDSSGVAGGWYIDDVAVLQASEISGLFTNMPGVDVVLYGQNYNGNIYDTTFTAGNGLFMFGFLPLGNYTFGSVSSIFGPIALTDANPAFSVGATNLAAPLIDGIMTGMPMIVTWPTVPGVTYRVQYTYNLMFGPWFDLADVVASGSIENYSDWNGDPLRSYRIWVLSTQ